MDARKVESPSRAHLQKQGRQSVVPKKRPGQTIERVRNAKISRPLSAPKTNRSIPRRSWPHFHHPLCAGAHERLSIRCWDGKTLGAGVATCPRRSSASMSFSWLFLGGLLSSRASERQTIS